LKGSAALLCGVAFIAAASFACNRVGIRFLR
jgi:hypothetical protein